MRAMILAAGRGERLRPLTDTCPKPLLKVGGRELLVYHLERLRSAGIREVIVNSAHLHAMITDFLGDGSRFGLHIEHSVEGERGLETAGGIIRALPFFRGEPFFVVNGDTYIEHDYARFLDYELAADEYAHLYMIPNPPHHPGGDFDIGPGGALIHGGTCTFSGAALYRPEPFAGLPVQSMPLLRFFNAWIDEGRVTAQCLNLIWFDVGTPGRMQELERYLEERRSSR